MRERPILFSAPMVRALLDGSKTQTRRIVKPQPPEDESIRAGFYHPTDVDRHGNAEPGDETFGAYTSDGEWAMKCTYGQPGDRLWVRESFNPWRFPGTGNVQIEYAADGAKEVRAVPSGKGYLLPDDDEVLVGNQNPPRFIRGKGRPSIHMPRWASRILLEIVSVRVERLNDISETDARAEGIEQDTDGWRDYLMPSTQSCTGPIGSYRTLWESINGAGAWDANPWVWHVEFRRVTP